MRPYIYGTLEPIYFRLTLSGVKVTGYTLLDADVYLYLDGVIYSVDAGEIGTECSEVGNGWYKWTPASVAQTQCKIGKLAISDSSLTNAFDDNGTQFYTGGDQAAFMGNVP